MHRYISIKNIRLKAGVFQKQNRYEYDSHAKTPTPRKYQISNTSKIKTPGRIDVGVS